VGKVQGPPSSSSRDKVTTRRRRGKERVELDRGPWRAVLAFLPRGFEFQVTPLNVLTEQDHRNGDEAG